MSANHRTTAAPRPSPLANGAPGPATDLLERSRSRSPEEMLGVAQQTRLAPAMIQASVVCGVLLVAMTAIPYFLDKPAPKADKPAAPAAAAAQPAPAKANPEPTTPVSAKADPSKPPADPTAKAAVKADAPKGPPGPDFLDKLG